ncbi:MAG TPA: Sua5/YciO/YrdC/YwlC family protein [Firmicutes bacterium]|nr:Sua5/YciO/YrdC/YwlC family protein [Bacillota bacterium]
MSGVGSICLLKSDNREEVIKRTISVLLNKGVVIFPTDTVYGIMGLAEPPVISRIFDLKGRTSKPIPVLFSDLDKVLSQFGVTPPSWLEEFSLKFWPGAITIVLDSSNIIPGISDTGSVGIRKPAFTPVLEVISGVGGFLGATSANLTGKPGEGDYRKIEHVFRDKTDLLVKGPESLVAPSTVIKYSNGVITLLRQGNLEFNIMKDFFIRCGINLR